MDYRTGCQSPTLPVTYVHGRFSQRRSFVKPARGVSDHSIDLRQEIEIQVLAERSESLPVSNSWDELLDHRIDLVAARVRVGIGEQNAQIHMCQTPQGLQKLAELRSSGIGLGRRRVESDEDVLVPQLKPQDSLKVAA